MKSAAAILSMPGLAGHEFFVARSCWGKWRNSTLARGLLGFCVSETAICETLWRNALSAFGMDRIAASLA
jgi:hypothetical protein